MDLPEALTSDKFEMGANGKTLQIRGLGSNSNGCSLIATLEKQIQRQK